MPYNPYINYMYWKEEDDEHHGGYSLPARRYVKGATANFCEDPDVNYNESLIDYESITNERDKPVEE